MGKDYLTASVETTAAALKLPTVQLFTAAHSVAQLRSKTPCLSLRLSNHNQSDHRSEKCWQCAFLQTTDMATLYVSHVPILRCCACGPVRLRHETT